MKQVLGKRINKQRYLCPCPVESHGRVDGLYSLRSSHEEGFTRPLPRYNNLFKPSNKSLHEFSWTHVPVNHNKWPSKHRHWQDTIQNESKRDFSTSPHRLQCKMYKLGSVCVNDWRTLIWVMRSRVNEVRRLGYTHIKSKLSLVWH